jgi:diguanylate cyclase (GGDEF)-like protein
MFALPDGTHEGFTVRFCDLLSDLFDIPFVAETYEWNELIEKLESRSVDFTGVLTPTEERKQVKQYLMTLPIAERQFRIFTLTGVRPIQTVEELEGRTIAFLEGTVMADIIRRTYRVSFNIVEIPHLPHGVKMLQNGEIDAIVDESPSDSVFEESDFIRSQIFFPAIHTPVSMTTANPELAPLISVVNKYITAGGEKKLLELYKSADFVYLKNKLNKSLTDEEKAYIKDLADRNATVGVAYEVDTYPITFYNKKEKEYQGIASDIVEEIGKLTDIKFANANSNVRPWAEIYEQLQTGEIPMAAELQMSATRQGRFLWCDAPYARSHYALLSRIDFPNLASHQISQHSVAIVKNSGHENIYRHLFPTNSNIREYDTTNDCLDALEKGEVDLMMGSEYALVAQSHYREKSGLKINLRLGTPLDSYFGFAKDEKVLCSIVSKAQQFVPTNDIERHWVNVVFDYSKKQAEERMFYLTGFAGVVSVILAGTLFLLQKTIRLDRIASKDGLTDIYNKRTFIELGLIQTDRMNRLGGTCFVVFFDLDNFKHVNDTYGHFAGDHVLMTIAQMVKKMIRPHDLFARYGGEEFMILMSDMEEEHIVSVVERIRQEVCRMPVVFEGKEIPITASFGIAYATPYYDLITAIKHADHALYQAKEGGRNQTVFRTTGN